jgi:hypothetical protein
MFETWDEDESVKNVDVFDINVGVSTPIGNWPYVALAFQAIFELEDPSSGKYSTFTCQIEGNYLDTQYPEDVEIYAKYASASSLESLLPVDTSQDIVIT